jgi:hypothetical protein
MIILGLDPHPGSHTVVALDSNGRLLANLTVPNTEAGLEQLHLFAKQFGARRWAIEGAGNHFIATFVNELLAQGVCVSWPGQPVLRLCLRSGVVPGLYAAAFPD